MENNIDRFVSPGSQLIHTGVTSPRLKEKITFLLNNLLLIAVVLSIIRVRSDHNVAPLASSAAVCFFPFKPADSCLNSVGPPAGLEQSRRTVELNPLDSNRSFCTQTETCPDTRI